MRKYKDFFFIRDNFKKYKDVKSKLIIKSTLTYKPKVTVVIPTFNRTHMLMRTIESILAQKNFSDYDIIVVDNNNIENNPTEQYLKKLDDNRISYYQNEHNIGQIGNWNRAIELASAKWVVLLHDDDILVDDYLYEVFKAIDANCDIEAIGTLFDEFYLDKENNIVQNNEINSSLKSILINIRNSIKYKFRGSLTKLSLKDYHFECGYYAPIGTFYKKKNFMDLGGFNDDFFPISDWVFHVNYMLNYNFYMLSLILTRKGIGVNESLRKDIRIGFVEEGYYFRKAILNKRFSLFNEWWIQIVSWYKAKRNFDLVAEDLDTEIIKIKYDTKFFEVLYLLIYRLYNITKKF